MESQNRKRKELKKSQGWAATSNKPLHSSGWICELLSFHLRDLLGSSVAAQKLHSLRRSHSLWQRSDLGPILLLKGLSKNLEETPVLFPRMQ